MQNASYQTTRLSVRNIKPATHTGELTRFILQLTAYAVFFLFIVIDGLRNPISYDSRFLTLPYLIGGLALARSIGEALTHHYDLHAVLFALGLSTLAVLA
jgi:hypothetical protein